MKPLPDQEVGATLADRLGSHSVDLLAARDRLAAEPEDPRDHSVRDILQRCAEYGRGCAELGRANNTTSLVIIARVILENLILILWVVIEKQNAIDQKDAAITELARAARINLQRGNARIINQSTGEDATADFLASDRFKKLPKRKSVEAKAREAGVIDLYNVFYRMFSLDVHGHDLIQANDPTDWSAAVSEMQAIGALLSAIEHAGSVWLLNRHRLSNDDLRNLLNLESALPNI